MLRRRSSARKQNSCTSLKALCLWFKRQRNLMMRWQWNFRASPVAWCWCAWTLSQLLVTIEWAESQSLTAFKTTASSRVRDSPSWNRSSQIGLILCSSKMVILLIVRSLRLTWVSRSSRSLVCLFWMKIHRIICSRWMMGRLGQPSASVMH